MLRLSDRERISLLMMRGWGDKKRSYSNVVQLFNVTFREAGPNISKATVSKTIRRFERTGSIKNHYHVGRPVSVTNEERSLDVMLSFIENPHQSTRQASLQHEMDPKSVQFCEEMMAFITQIPRFLKNIVFSDEATFQLNGNVNRQNCSAIDYRISCCCGGGDGIGVVGRCCCGCGCYLPYTCQTRFRCLFATVFTEIFIQRVDSSQLRSYNVFEKYNYVTTHC
uniref:DUF4817 domain-containing protein n=1 Tax=Trichogramma kaykai TaxID=54128 RepID=A0ABD2VUW7_9HYME